MKRSGIDSNRNFIHDDARVHDTVVLGRSNYFGPRVIVGEGTVIGSRNEFVADVVIGSDVKVMNGVELREGTVISDGCEIDSGVKSSGKCVVGENTVVRYDAIIARGCRIGADCYICPQVMTNNLDHNMDEVGGAHVGDHCFIGTASVLGAGINIAKGTLVGSCSNVTKSIEEPYHVWYGNPAEDRGERDFTTETLADIEAGQPERGDHPGDADYMPEEPAEEPEEEKVEEEIEHGPDGEPNGPKAALDTDSGMSGGGEEG